MGLNIVKEFVTNVTQYEQSSTLSQASSGPTNISLCSSIQKSSSGCRSDNDDEEDYTDGKNDGSIRVSFGAKIYQTMSNELGDSRDDQNVKKGTEQ